MYPCRRYLLASRPLLGAILFLLSLTSAPAYAETENCTEVPSVPYTITTQGLWCFKHDLTTAQTSGAVITITANNVALDLNGWKLGGQAAGAATTAIGIFSTADNVTVKNGIVRGFFTGIQLQGRGATIQGMLVDQNTQRGILVTGQDTIVRNNQVVDTGGSTFAGNISAIGIQSNGTASLVEHNVVAGLTAMGNESEWGIYVAGPSSSLVRNNFVTDTVLPTGGASYGIYIYSGAKSVNVDKNTVSNFNFCIAYVGLGTGIYTRNTVTNCDTNYSNGTDGGGNAP